MPLEFLLHFNYLGRQEVLAFDQRAPFHPTRLFFLFAVLVRVQILTFQNGYRLFESPMALPSLLVGV